VRILLKYSRSFIRSFLSLILVDTMQFCCACWCFQFQKKAAAARQLLKNQD